MNEPINPSTAVLRQDTTQRWKDQSRKWEGRAKRNFHALREEQAKNRLLSATLKTLLTQLGD